MPDQAAPPPPHVHAASAKAQASADAMAQDDSLARSKGKSPEQIEARKRVAALFCQFHLPGEKTDALKLLLDSIDYTSPITSTNARGIDVNNPKGGLLGFGRKPRYLLSKAFPPPPDQPDAPIYALEYFPRA